MQNVYQFTCIRQKVPHNMGITGQSRIVDPQYGIGFMSPFWHLECGVGSYMFGKFADACFTVNIMSLSNLNR